MVFHFLHSVQPEGTSTFSWCLLNLAESSRYYLVVGFPKYFQFQWSSEIVPVLVGVFQTSQRAAGKSEQTALMVGFPKYFHYQLVFQTLQQQGETNLRKQFATTSKTISPLSPISWAFTRRQDSRQQKVINCQQSEKTTKNMPEG